MRNFSKPIVVVSSCLEFEKVRYDGNVIPSKIIRELEPFVNYIKVCPEVGIGLSIPRDPLRIVEKNGKRRLMQPKTNKDFTDEMERFTDNFIDSLENVDGFIFKSKSPSIGAYDAKVYAKITQSPVIGKSPGIFSGIILEKYNEYPIEDNDRLRNDKIRHHFFTKLFTFSELRNCKNLEEFNENNKILFELYNERLLEELKEINDLNDYRNILGKFMKRLPSHEKYLEIFLKLFDKFSGNLSEQESNYFKEALKDYKSNKICVNCIIKLLKSYAIRFKDNDILKQTFFEPYPAELRPIIDPDRDKNYWKK